MDDTPAETSKPRGYQVRCTGIENEKEAYFLMFGKSSKKLVGTVRKVDGKWQLVEGDGPDDMPLCKTLKELKEAWGEWARSTYCGGSVADTAGEPTSDTPSPRKPVGPPSFKKPTPKGPPSFKPPKTVAQVAAEYPEPNEDEVNAYLDEVAAKHPNEYLADPFDPRFVTDSPNRFLTPTGALEQVFLWLETQSVMTGVRHWDQPWLDVIRTLHREYPGDERYAAMARKQLVEQQGDGEIEVPEVSTEDEVPASPE